MADKKLQRAVKLANEFAASPAGKVALKPVPKPKIKPKNWVQKLGEKVKSVFASTKKKSLVSDPNKENLGEQNVHSQARAGNALTEEEWKKHYGKK